MALLDRKKAFLRSRCLLIGNPIKNVQVYNPVPSQGGGYKCRQIFTEFPVRRQLNLQKAFFGQMILVNHISLINLHYLLHPLVI